LSSGSGSHEATGWEEAGRATASLLSDYWAIAVVSSDPNAAAEVALGIARAEARHRRAVVGDLVGDLAALTELVTSDDPHGISDSFLYGISLSSIGREVPGEQNLVVMLSGIEPVFDREIIASRRWERLAAGFGEVGALLLLVAQADTPGLSELLVHLNGVVLVRDQELPAARDSLVLARVPAPARLMVGPEVPAAPAGEPGPRDIRKLVAISALCIMLLAVAGVIAFQKFRGGSSPAHPSPRAAALAPLAPPETLYVAPPVNPDEAGSAAGFAVELVAANTAEAANLEMRRHGASLPSATVTPVPIGPERATWYKLIAGAYVERREADSLLAALRKSKILDDSSGTVVDAPLALLVDSLPSQNWTSADLKKFIDSYSARGFSVYPLLQKDGRARLYAGAFARGEQAGALVKAFTAAGIKPLLAYRTGHAPK
jgi:hypothetical protein